MNLRTRSPKRAVWTIVSLAALALPFVAQAALVRTGDALVQFTAIGPGGLRMVGKSGELQVSDSGSAVKVTVPLGGLKTGIDLRDNHMRDKYLQVGQYPTAQLEVQRGALKQPAAGGSVTAEADGKLTLHGKTKPVRFKYAAQHEGNRIKVEGGVRIDMRDFGIEVPNYLGVKVRPEVDTGARFYVAEGK